MKKVIIAIVTIGVLAVGHFIYWEFFWSQRAYYSILSESQATELTDASKTETPAKSSQYAKWVGDWVPKKGLELREPYYLHVELDSSGLPAYEVRFLTGYYYQKGTTTFRKLMDMLDLVPPERDYAIVHIPGELTFEISLTHNPETDKMEWTGTKYGNGKIISEKKVTLIRREQSELAADSIPFKVKRVKAHMRSMGTGIEAYYVDHSSYPAWVIGSHPLAFNKAPATRKMPSFRMGVKTKDQKGREIVVPYTLTTPMAYIIRYIEDPFLVSPTDPQPTFSYYTGMNGWIVASPGPDGDYDINPEQDYRPDIPQLSERLVIKTYDPTNGLVSDGDIFRIKAFPSR